MALKSQFGLSRDAFDSMLTVFESMLPEEAWAVLDRQQLGRHGEYAQSLAA